MTCGTIKFLSWINVNVGFEMCICGVLESRGLLGVKEKHLDVHVV